jgi:hypothetical protein
MESKELVDVFHWKMGSMPLQAQRVTEAIGRRLRIRVMGIDWSDLEVDSSLKDISLFYEGGAMREMFEGFRFVDDMLFSIKNYNSVNKN